MSKQNGRFRAGEVIEASVRLALRQEGEDTPSSNAFEFSAGDRFLVLSACGVASWGEPDYLLLGKNGLIGFVLEGCLRGVQ